MRAILLPRSFLEGECLANLDACETIPGWSTSGHQCHQIVAKCQSRTKRSASCPESAWKAAMPRPSMTATKIVIALVLKTIGVASQTICSKAVVSIRQDRLAMLPHFVTAMHNQQGSVSSSRLVVEQAQQVQTDQHSLDLVKYKLNPIEL